MLVSTIIPSYNRSTVVAAAIRSALRQTHSEQEIIVVDDGSEDDTATVLKRFGGAIRVIQQANAGPSAARNRGASEARGPLLAFLDSDDLWEPTKLQRQADLMARAGPAMCCCVCNATLIEEGTGCVGRSFDKAGIRPRLAEGEWTNPQELLASRFLLFNQTAMIRRRSFEECGGYRAQLHLLEDYELAVRLTNHGRWGFIRDPLVRKYNSSEGAGVRCMEDRLHHVAVAAETIAGILQSGIRLSTEARDLFEQALADLRMREEAFSLQDSTRAVDRMRGRAMEFTAKAVLSLRRRSESWPGFNERPLRTLSPASP